MFSGLTAGLSSGAGCDFALDPAPGATTLTLSNVDSPDPVNDGGDITYTITATNTGGGDAVSVVVVVTLDAAVTFVSNVGTGWAFTRVGQVITARADMIPSGIAPVITVVGTAPAGGSTSVTTTASIVAANAATQNANATTSVIGAIAGVTRDATNRNYYPANASEWTTFMTAIGLATGNPASVWNMQEASGNYADAIGGITLSELDPGSMVYQADVTGTARNGTRGSDGTANQRAINVTTAPNPSTTDILVILYLQFPGSAPAANRDLMGLAAASTLYDILFLANGSLRLSTSANADTVNSVVGTRGWFAYRSRLTATADASLFTTTEKRLGTAATPLSGAVIWFGGQTGLSSSTICAYMAEFTGAAARLSDAQLKTLVNGLGGNAPW